MSTFGTTKTRNANPDGSVPLDKHGQPAEWCGYCCNEGVVMLEGSTIVGGVTYSRGSAPCPWCMQGELRYAQWSSDTAEKRGTDRQGGKHVTHHRRLDPASGFTMFDVLDTPREPRGRDVFTPNPGWLLEREAAGIPRGALQAITPRNSWPPAWRSDHADQVVGDLGLAEQEEIRRKRALALKAKNEAEREQEGSP
jgi:hypothetical protein